jgi:hypothetical protein
MKPHGSYLYNSDFADKFADAFDRASSDKASYHAYHEIYSHLLHGREVKSFLEIGLFLSNNEPTTDLHAWAEVLPNAEIFGADWKAHLLFSTDRIKTHYVNQDVPESFDFLKKQLPEKVDVILEDASHILAKTITTFEQMWDRVADGGLYMIEDILVRRYSDSDWEQNVEELDEYFSQTGLDYEIFSTSTIRKCVDSIVLAVHKKQ